MSEFRPVGESAQHATRERAERERDLAAIEKLARKHGQGSCLHNLRHSWATRALQNGVDPVAARG